MKLTIIVFLFLSSFWQACDKSSPTELPKTNLDVNVAQLRAQEQKIIQNAPQGVNKLNFDLYQELSSVPNLVFSPFSISLVLAMTYAGAKELTESEMKKALYFGDNTLAFHKSFGELANLFRL